MIEVKKDDQLLCFYKRKDNWKKGLDFFTDNQDFIQVGTWWYDRGKKLDRHYHNVVERISKKTNECVVVLSGSMNVDVYDDKQIFVTSFILREGDFAVFLNGGHGYEILSDNTMIVETKNGPFLGVDIDKTRF